MEPLKNKTLLFFLSIIIILSSNHPIYASLDDGVNNSYFENDALESNDKFNIPLSLEDRVSLTDYFHFVTNSSSKYDSDEKIVVITQDSPNQLGMLWSKDKFSLSKPAHFESYIFIGSENDQLADGLTLTLWSEDEYTDIDRLGLSGSSLGIYHMPYPSTNQNYARNYIAFELDYYMNTDIWNGYLDNNNSGITSGGHADRKSVV